MMVLRIVAYAALGAAIAAAVLAGFQLYIFQLSGVDPARVPLATLLVEVMQLPRYGLLGAILGAVVAPFPARERHPAVRLLSWTTLGVLVGLAVPFARTLLALQHVPTFSDAVSHFALDPRALIGGAAAGFLLSWVETLAETVQHWRRARQRGRAEPRWANDVDATLKAYWRDRAETYLAHREHRG